MSSDSETEHIPPEEDIKNEDIVHQRTEIRKKLGTMSFEELLKMKEEMGSKLYNKILSGPLNTKQDIKIKRANKNRPQEISSKIRIKINQKPATSKLKKYIVQHRDPRFDPLCGKFYKDKFKDDYKFIHDLQEKEKQILLKEENMELDVEHKKKLKLAIQKLNNKTSENKIMEKKHLKVIEKQEIKDKLKRGEAPYKQKSVKAEHIIQHYEELKKTNKLDKYLIKKSKKIKANEIKRHNK